ncbi:hypothetical protein CRUP_002988, partial [Coryphaenoides rupestris]
VKHVYKVGPPDPRQSGISQSESWWEKRGHHVMSLRDQLLEKDQHVAGLQDMLRTEREKMRCGQQEAELRRSEQLSNRLKAPIEVLNLVPGGRRKRKRENLLAKITTRQEEIALGVMLERREAELREAMKVRHSTTTLLHALRVNME